MTLQLSGRLGFMFSTVFCGGGRNGASRLAKTSTALALKTVVRIIFPHLREWYLPPREEELNYVTFQLLRKVHFRGSYLTSRSQIFDPAHLRV